MDQWDREDLVGQDVERAQLLNVSSASVTVVTVKAIKAGVDFA